MMVGWKEKKDFSIAEVTRRAGPGFEYKFLSDNVLSGDETWTFLKALNLKSEPVASYSAEKWLEFLRAHGPLWVVSNESRIKGFSMHARIIIGIGGDGSLGLTFLTFLDPATGGRSSESLQEFTKKLQQVVEFDLKQGSDLRPQVIHF